MRKIYRWKFLREGLKSKHGDLVWKIGEEKVAEGKISLCNNGFHCSKTKWQAFSYVQGELLAKVEVGGKNEISDDKEVWEKMKIVKVWKWQKKDSVALAIFSSRLVLANYEKEFPNDNRPRKAIEATEKWLENPTKENELSAAWSAAWSAAESAWSAARSAWSAAESAARSAAESAESAARSAAESAAESAWSAWSARSARSARSAAESAAESAKKKIFSQITKWINDRNLEDYEN